MALKPVGAQLILEDRGFFSGMKKANNSLSDFGKSAKGTSVGTIALGTALGNLAAGGLLAVTRGLIDATKAGVGFLAGSVGMAADLEAQMSGVGAVLGATNEELDQLNALVVDLGIDPNLKVSSLEAAQAIEVLAKNGLSMDQIMDGAARSTVFLANSTGANFATAADVATDAMSQFNISAGDMGRAVDGITGVVTNSKFDIDDYRLAIANAGAIASASGVTFEDFNTALAATASSFASGSDAGTSLKTTLQRLSNPTGKAAELMDELGISLFDSEGNTRSLSEVIDQLNAAFSTMTTEQQAATAAQLGGADASRTLLALAQMTGAEFETLSEKVNAQGQAADAAAMRVNNFAGAMDILDGIVESVRLQIGDALLPVMTELARIAGEFIEGNAAGLITFFEDVGAGISQFVSNLQAGVDPMTAFQALAVDLFEAFGMGRGDALGLATDIKNIVDSVQEAISTISTFVSDHAEAFKGALIGIGAVLAAAGIAAGIAAVTAAVTALLSPIGLLVAGAALLGAAWSENWGGIQEKTQVAVDFVVGKFELLKSWWGENGAAITETFQGVFDGMAAYLTGWGEVLVSAWNAAVSLFQGDFAGFGENLGAAWAGMWQTTIDWMATLWELVSPHLAALYTSVTNWFTSQDWAAHGQTVITAIGDAFGSLWSVVGPKFTALYTSVTNWFAGIDWEEVGFAAGEMVATGLGAIVIFVTDILPGWWSSIQAWFSGIDWDTLGTTVTDGFAEGISGGLTNVMAAVSDFIKGFVDGFKSKLGSASPSKVFDDIGRDTIQGFINGILAMMGDVIAAVSDIGETAVSKIKGFVGQMVSAGKDLIGGLVEGIKSGASSVVNAITDVVGGAIAKGKDLLGISSPSKVFIKIGEQIAQGLAAGITAGSKSVVDAVGKLLSAAGNLTNIGQGVSGRLLEPIQKRVDDWQASLDMSRDALAEMFGRDALSDFDINELFVQSQLRPDLFSQEQLRLIERANFQQNQLGAATAELRAEQEKLLQIEKQRADLAFLQQQLDLIKLVRDQGLDASILQGLQFGMEADLSALLSAVSAATQAMINQAATDLGIASPSKVFAKFGADVMQGMAQGVASNALMPARAVAGATTQMIRPPASAQTIINRSQQNTFNTTVSNNMDANTLIAMIRQTVAGAI